MEAEKKKQAPAWLRWRRLVALVSAHYGNRHFGLIYVEGAAAGNRFYSGLVRSAILATRGTPGRYRGAAKAVSHG